MQKLSAWFMLKKPLLPVQTKPFDRLRHAQFFTEENA